MRYTNWKAYCSSCHTYQQDWRLAPKELKCAGCGRRLEIKYFKLATYVTPLVRIARNEFFSRL